jgi:hypothetical protein
VHAKKAGKPFDPDYIEKIGLACSIGTEIIHRIMYYDCAPFVGSAIQPVSGTRRQFSGTGSPIKICSRSD